MAGLRRLRLPRGRAARGAGDLRRRLLARPRRAARPRGDGRRAHGGAGAAPDAAAARPRRPGVRRDRRGARGRPREPAHARPGRARRRGSRRRSLSASGARRPGTDRPGTRRSTGSLLAGTAAGRPASAWRSASRVASSSATSSALRCRRAATWCSSSRIRRTPSMPMPDDGQVGDHPEQLEVAVGVAPPAAPGAAGRDQAHPLVGAQGLRVQAGQLGGDADDVDGRVGVEPAEGRARGHAITTPRTGWRAAACRRWRRGRPRRPPGRSASR